MQTVTVILTEIEAETFKQFQQHRDLFKTLYDNGVFDIQYGKCTMNIAFGKIQNIVKEESIYRAPDERRVKR